MDVLMDIEWLQSSNGPQITQVAALRIGDGFQPLSLFYQRVQPGQVKKQEWRRICFNGGSMFAFITADPLTTVLRMLKRWTKPEDRLLWWHDQARSIFEKAWKQNCGSPSASCIIGPQVKRAIRDSLPKRGSPHDLCVPRGIGVSEPAHHSANDVTTLRNLLERLSIPVSALLDESAGVAHGSPENTVLLPEGYGSAVPELRPVNSKKAKKRPVFCSTRSHRGVVHYRECPVLRRVAAGAVRRFSSMQAAHASGYRLCAHCASVRKVYAPVRKAAEKYCADHRLSCRVLNGELYITSQYDLWRIIINRDTGLLELYHKNYRSPSKECERSRLPGYHIQHPEHRDILSMLRSIAGHDSYREDAGIVPKRRKVQKKKPACIPPARRSKKGRQAFKREKQRQRERAAKRTLALIDELIANEEL